MAADELIEKMRRDWDGRARENARYYIVNSRKDWPDEDFARSGEETVARYVMTDMGNACQGKSPKEMRVLDFGCGVGRVTRALAGIFGEVHGVDISGEMVKLAQTQLSDLPNVRVHQTNGRDLDVLGDLMFDFAFSFSAFHHVPGKALIENCIRDVASNTATPTFASVSQPISTAAAITAAPPRVSRKASRSDLIGTRTVSSHYA